MKDYTRFSAEDFATDDDFIKWVKYAHRYPDLDVFWTNWLQTYPHRQEEVEEAKLMIRAILEEPQHIPDAEKQKAVWKDISVTLNLLAQEEKRTIPFWRKWYSKAAMVMIVLGIGWYSYRVVFVGHPAVNHHPVIAMINLEKQVNNGDVPKTIILEDGTSIVLQPHSMLRYPKHFKIDLREVYLIGEAFFEVKKDPNRPFIVHANEIVTRVLGTSFTVRNFIGEKKVMVQVKTGKVSVFKDLSKEKKKAPVKDEVDRVEGVVLMPNQQVVYERNAMKMVKSLVENPSVLIPVAKLEFEFTDEPIREVFKAIENAYGVEIVYDEEVLSNCYINASLSDVPLYDKMKLICKGIDATYEIIDSHIIVYGKGCSTR
jgi:transmembrane sensor